MFIEDYPYGICIFKDIALMENVNTPVIDMLLKFYENLTGKQYFKMIIRMEKILMKQVYLVLRE